MAITKYENVKNTLFTSKEHYIAFRKEWCKYVNSNEAKPYWVDAYKNGKVKRCNLTNVHHLLFCILTETDVDKAFKPSPTLRKEGFREAYSLCGSVKEYAMGASLILKSRIPGIPKLPIEQENFEIAHINKFLKPFGGTVTLEMLARLYDEFMKHEILTNIYSNRKEAA